MSFLLFSDCDGLNLAENKEKVMLGKKELS